MAKISYQFRVNDGSNDIKTQSGTTVEISVRDKKIYAAYVVTTTQCRLVHVASGMTLQVFGKAEYKSPRKYIIKMFEAFSETYPEEVLEAIKNAEVINNIPEGFI